MKPNLPPLSLPLFLMFLGVSPARAIDSASKGISDDRGLTKEAVLELAKPSTLSRERPSVVYRENGPSPKKQGSIDYQRIRVRLYKPSGPARKAAFVSFGFPLPEGALFDLKKLRIIKDHETVIPTALSVLSLWPDGSLKSVLVCFRSAFDDDQPQTVAVEFGSQVRRAESSAPTLHWVENDDAYHIDTGKVEITVGKDGFLPLREVARSGKLLATGGGIELRDGDGSLYSSALLPPERISVERRSATDLSLRFEGRYGDGKGHAFMRYITRINFTAGSSRIDLVHTHVNDEISREFSDFGSLAYTLTFPDADGWSVSSPGGPSAAPSLTLLQLHESFGTSTTPGGEEPLAPRSSGVIHIDTPSGSLQTGISHFWQRWPKGIEATDGKLILRLLPPQPEGFGADLPAHLAYPFLKGRYRLKWGMSFTERFSFDFAPEESAEAFAYELNDPIIAVIDRDYLASTSALGFTRADIAWPGATAWDAYAERSLGLHRAQRSHHREYGFLNWGDWYGERGRNWGNNEYDRAHGFFTHFARTGSLAFHEDAVAAARHQADVDIVHAYPDPYYVGANQQHSIGHTGVSYQAIPPSWSRHYDVATSAGNGHTWTDGLADCWLLTGDPVVMESLIALGEHIAGAWAPGYKRLIYPGVHERNAGWSMLAALGAYRATSDAFYLEAAQRIAAVVLREWDPHSGVWPHELPSQHANGVNRVIGNSTFNIGILLLGLCRVHAVAPSPQLRTCIDRTADWLMKAWDAKTLSWPYAADTAGRPVSPPSPNLNSLIAPGLAYAGLIMGKKDYIDTAATAFAANFPPGAADPAAKEFSIKACTATEMLSILAQAEPAGQWPSGYDVMKSVEVRKAITLIPGQGPRFRITQVAPKGGILRIAAVEGTPIEQLEFSLTDEEGRSIAPTERGKQECQWHLPGSVGSTYLFTLRHPLRWNLSGEGITADLISGPPLKLRAAAVAADWIAPAGDRTTLRGDGDGIGAMLLDTEGGRTVSTSDGSARTWRLPHISDGKPARLIMWANSSWVLTLPTDSPIQIRLIDSANP